MPRLTSFLQLHTMKLFSPFLLLIGGLALSLQANAQGRSFIDGSLAAHRPTPATGLLTAIEPARHSSQLPTASPESAPALAEATAPSTAEPTSLRNASAGAASAAGASKSQLLLVLFETLQAQQVQIEALRAQAAAATRRASEAEAATVAFEQRLRQIEAAGSRPSFWR